MLKVLYVDDDADIREIAEMSLGLDPDMEVRTAASGTECLNLLETGPWRPDVLLLDMMMPGLDGASVLARIRGLEQRSTLPVIFVTARSRETELSRFMELGATGVITKPFDPMSLARQIRGLVAFDR